MDRSRDIFFRMAIATYRKDGTQDFAFSCNCFTTNFQECSERPKTTCQCCIFSVGRNWGTGFLPCSVPCIHVHDMVPRHGHWFFTVRCTVQSHGKHASMVPWHVTVNGTRVYYLYRGMLSTHKYFHIWTQTVILLSYNTSVL